MKRLALTVVREPSWFDKLTMKASGAKVRSSRTALPLRGEGKSPSCLPTVNPL